jgi:hypothetical protein
MVGQLKPGLQARYRFSNSDTVQRIVVIHGDSCIPCLTTEHSSGAWSVSLRLTLHKEFSLLVSRQLRKGDTT